MTIDINIKDNRKIYKRNLSDSDLYAEKRDWNQKTVMEKKQFKDHT